MKPQPRAKRASATRRGIKLTLVSLGEQIEQMTTPRAFEEAWLRFTDDMAVPREMERHDAAIFKAGYTSGVADVVHLLKVLADLVKEAEAAA